MPLFLLPYFLSNFLLLSLSIFSFSLRVFSSLFFLTSCFFFFFSYFYCSWLPHFIPSSIIEFTHFVPQPFFASCWHLSKITHYPVGCPVITSTQSVLVVPLSIFKQNYLSYFLPLSVSVLPQWIRIKLPHHLPLWQASSGHSSHLPLLGEMLSQQDIPPKKLRQKPQNRPPFSPLPNYTL